jgi:hypothetical protein
MVAFSGSLVKQEEEKLSDSDREQGTRNPMFRSNCRGSVKDESEAVESSAR